jgi:hypothetical protein
MTSSAPSIPVASARYCILEHPNPCYIWDAHSGVVYGVPDGRCPPVGHWAGNQTPLVLTADLLSEARCAAEKTRWVELFGLLRQDPDLVRQGTDDQQSWLYVAAIQGAPLSVLHTLYELGVPLSLASDLEVRGFCANRLLRQTVLRVPDLALLQTLSLMGLPCRLWNSDTRAFDRSLLEHVTDPKMEHFVRALEQWSPVESDPHKKRAHAFSFASGSDMENLLREVKEKAAKDEWVTRANRYWHLLGESEKMVSDLTDQLRDVKAELRASRSKEAERETQLRDAEDNATIERLEADHATRIKRLARRANEHWVMPGGYYRFPLKEHESQLRLPACVNLVEINGKRYLVRSKYEAYECVRSDKGKFHYVGHWDTDRHTLHGRMGFRTGPCARNVKGCTCTPTVERNERGDNEHVFNPCLLEKTNGM